MANRGKTRQIEDVKRSKIVVEIGVFYYRCPFVTLGDLECIGFFSRKNTYIFSLFIRNNYPEYPLPFSPVR